MGRLVVIEGLDGSGKATQAQMLCEKLKLEGKRFRKISFPDYGNPSSSLVRLYLDGKVGTLSEVNPYAASSFYSLDRYISYQTIWKGDYLGGAEIIADRYTTSNISHQMVKFPRGKWEDYIGWLTGYEYGLLGLPRPDLVIYLDMHPEASKELIERRSQRTGAKKDLHEQDFEYLLGCREAALFAAGLLGWRVIPCNDVSFRPLALDEIAVAVYNEYHKLR